MTVQNKKTTFGVYIRNLRLSREIGLRDLARQLGISAPYLSDLEKDKRGAPRPELVRTIAKILDADSEIIYDRAETIMVTPDNIPIPIKSYGKAIINVD